MIRMCIISDKIIKPQGFTDSKIDGYRWYQSSAIDLSAFEIVVLDQEIKSQRSLNFTLARKRIESLLRSSGVVICLTYNTVENDSIFVKDKKWFNDEKGILKWSQTGVRRKELSYDWLGEDFAAQLGLLSKATGLVGKEGIIKPKNERFRRYFDGVETCHKVIEGTKRVGDIEDLRALFTANNRSKTGPGINAIYIAEIKTTKKPVAAGIEINNGIVIFLPQTTKKALESISDLYEIGVYVYNSIQEEEIISEKRPEWITSYILQSEKEVENEIDVLSGKIEELKNRQSYYRKIARLLFTGGKLLEDAVDKVFEDFGLDFIRSEHNEPYDFIISNILDSGQVFVEVTGEKVIKQGSRKMGQLLATIREIDITNDRILFLINCQREIKPTKRKMENMLTPQARRIFNNNEVSIIQTYEVYDLWKRTKKTKLRNEDMKSWFKDRIENRQII